MQIIRYLNIAAILKYPNLARFSELRWFEDRAPACTLLVYIDEAPSRFMQLHFTYSESTFSYFEATQAYLGRYGKPQAF